MICAPVMPVTTVLQIAELWFLHIQIMQIFLTNIARAKLVDSQTVFVFSVGGLDTSQYLLIEIGRICPKLEQVFSRGVYFWFEAMNPIKLCPEH